MTRSEAFEFVQKNLKNKNMLKHCLASEAVMRALADHFNQDKEMWGLAGLLHDADSEIASPDRQGVVVGEMLKGKLVPEIIYAMAAHNEETGIKPKSKIDWGLFSSEKMTGLIVAAALILPAKKLSDVTAEMVLRRFKEKSFARGAKRESIKECEKLGLSLEDFTKICLKAMQNISNDLGL